jgi:hypothetical protein
MPARRSIVLVLTAVLGGCSDFLTDGATRVAYELEAGAGTLDPAEHARLTLTHRPKASPEGCAWAYKLQLSANAGLVIWCFDGAGKTTGSHITTYHLRFVDVPQTWILDKAAQVPTTIELERRNGRATVVEVR